MLSWNELTVCVGTFRCVDKSNCVSVIGMLSYFAFVKSHTASPYQRKLHRLQSGSMAASMYISSPKKRQCELFFVSIVFHFV